ncbi:TniQ family protein [Streptomyces scopuliridis]|uniref:TniQ family protein n=1 Tax=Streptomyces scopuliridis TaxID=452529 RepID=UPI0036C7A010
MSSVLDTIPIRVHPLPGEALDSWLDAYAHRLQVQAPEILALAGLHPSKSPSGSIFGRKPWTPDLYPEDFAALSAVSGVAGEQLREMTIARYSGSLVYFDPQTRALDRKETPWWRRVQASRYCPEWLGDTGGRWMLSWRLPWSFVCLHHERLLLDTCPACDRRPRLDWSRRGRTPPGFCHTSLPAERRHTGKKRAPRCLHPFAKAASLRLTAASQFLTAQRAIDDLLDSIVDAHGEGRESLPHLLGRLEDLHASARTALSALHLTTELPSVTQDLLTELGTTASRILPGDHSGGGMLAADAPATAFALTTACHLLRDGAAQPEPDITRWLLEATLNSAGEAAPSAIFQRERWARATPELQGALLKQLVPRLRPQDRLRYRTEGALPSRPAPEIGRARARMTPSFFWRGLALRLTPPNVLSAAPLSYRASLSMLLTMVGSSDLDYDRARELLFPAKGKACVNRPGAATHRLQQTGSLSSVLTAVTEIARRLDEYGSPIDYDRRRRSFTEAEFDQRAYQEFCDDIGLRRADASELMMLRWALIEILTGIHPQHLPLNIKIEDRQCRSYEHWRFKMTEPVATHLHQQALHLLDAASIDEPVQWEPPSDWTNGIELPGPNPDSIPTQELWRLVQSRSEASKIAAAFDTTTEHIRVAMRLHPRPLDPRSPSRNRVPPNNKIPRKQLPTAQQIKDDQAAGISQRRIAEAAGCSRSLVRRILAAAGAQGNPPGRPPTHTIDPDWLRLEYETKHKSMTMISKETGISPNALRLRARKLGIPIRHRGHPAHPLSRHGSSEDFPPGIWNAFHGKNAEQRVRNFLDALGHHSIPLAAKHLRMNGPTLRKQIDHVESAVGTPLLHRTTGGQRRLRLTPAGRAFAKNARTTLALLEGSASSTAT